MLRNTDNLYSLNSTKNEQSFLNNFGKSIQGVIASSLSKGQWSLGRATVTKKALPENIVELDEKDNSEDILYMIL